MILGNGRLAKIIGTAVAVVIVEHILILTDAAIAGRAFGSSAYAAMTLVTPVFSIVTLVSALFAVCMSYLYSCAKEEKDRYQASKIVRAGLGGSLVIGLVLLGLATLVEYPYLNFFNPSKETMELFDDYWGWFSLVVILEFFGFMLMYLVYVDGGKKICVISYLVHIPANVFFAYMFGTGKLFFADMGMEGVSFGTVIAHFIGIAILLGYFLDRRRCQIRFFERTPEVHTTEPQAVENRYEVLRGNQMTIGDLDGVIELDKMSLESCYQVTAGDDYLLFKDNPENGIIIRDRETGKIVGYSMLLPIRQDMYEKIKTGTFVDTDFKPEMTFKYGKPGIYHLYFASVVVHPEHRSAALILTMLDAMVEDFIHLATKRGIWFSDMIADVVTNDGAKFCRLFGLKKVCDTNHNSWIYEVKGFPPGVRETTPATKKLVQLYRRKYETL